MSAAVIAACNCVALTNVVVRLVPFQLTTDPLRNPVPFTVRVKAAVPAVALDGERELMVGIGLAALMVNAALLEVPPPGAGLNTVTWPVPAEAISDAVIAACNCVALTNVVVRLAPFQLTTDPLRKPVPFTVSVKAAVPAVALDGDSELTVGIGLAALMVNAAFPEVPPPGAGLNTVTWPVPAVPISAAVIAACSCVPLTNVVVRLLPFHLTIEPLRNPVPFIVRVKAAVPAVALDGDSELIVGTALVAVTVNAEFPDVPPPGAGLDTVICAVIASNMSRAVTVTCSCVALTNVVVRAPPFQFTTEEGVNPAPFTVRVKERPPANAVAGNSEIIDGTGCSTLMVPPVPVMVALVPTARTAKRLPTAMGTEEPAIPGGKSNWDTVATTPVPIVFAFIPVAKQMTVPLAALQLSVFPAAVSAGPAVGVREEMLAGA